MEFPHHGASDPNLNHRNVLHSIATVNLEGKTVRVDIEEEWNEKEWSLQNYFIYIDGVRSGYLRTRTFKKDLYEESFPTIYEFLRKRMKLFGLRNHNDLDKYKNGKELLERAKIKMESEHEKIDQTYIDYTYVGDGKDPHFPINARGKGYGKTLYITAAEFLSLQDKVLHSSDTVSDSAKRVWNSLEKLGYTINLPLNPSLGPSLGVKRVVEKNKSNTAK